MKKRRILLCTCAVLVLIAIACAMLVIGRGHTMYFDNKEMEYDGQSYEAIRRINVLVDGEQVAKLSDGDRGMATFTGQTFSFDIVATREKGGEEEPYSFTVKVPYGQDGIIVNLIGMIENLPQDAWMSEFVPAVVVEEEDEEIITDEFDMGVGDDVAMEG